MSARMRTSCLESATRHRATSPGGRTPSSSRRTPVDPPLSDIATIAVRFTGYFLRPESTVNVPVPRILSGLYASCHVTVSAGARLHIMNTSSNAMWGLAMLLFIVILVLAYFLFAMPAPQPSDSNNGTPTTTPVTVARVGTLSEKVVIVAPAAGATVQSNFTVSGQAPGNWYFEASFPIEVRDMSGNQLLQLPAQAEGEWMTTELVAFSVSITVSNYTGPALLILHRDNPSALPENDSSVTIPIVIQ